MLLPLALVSMWLPSTLSSGSSSGSFSSSALYRRQVACPTDPSIQGYVSIQDMNQDMKLEAARLAPPTLKEPLDRYTFRICPHTTLLGSEQLTPLLDRVEFICGANGDSQDQCIIQGGATQVLLLVQSPPRNGTANSTNTTTTTTDTIADTRQLYVFRGITFQDSQQLSIAALAPSFTTSAEFYDCHWKVCSSYPCNCYNYDLLNKKASFASFYLFMHNQESYRTSRHYDCSWLCRSYTLW